MLQGDPANGFPVQDVMVGRLQRRRMTDGELLLSPSKLGVILLDRHPLRFERRDDVVDHRGGDVHAGRAVLRRDRESTRLNSRHSQSSYAVFCLKKIKMWLSFVRCITYPRGGAAGSTYAPNSATQARRQLRRS